MTENNYPVLGAIHITDFQISLGFRDVDTDISFIGKNFDLDNVNYYCDIVPPKGTTSRLERNSQTHVSFSYEGIYISYPEEPGNLNPEQQRVFDKLNKFFLDRNYSLDLVKSLENVELVDDEILVKDTQFQTILESPFFDDKQSHLAYLQTDFPDVYSEIVEELPATPSEYWLTEGGVLDGNYINAINFTTLPDAYAKIDNSFQLLIETVEYEGKHILCSPWQKVKVYNEDEEIKTRDNPFAIKLIEYNYKVEGDLANYLYGDEDKILYHLVTEINGGNVLEEVTDLVNEEDFKEYVRNLMVHQQQEKLVKMSGIAHTCKTIMVIDNASYNEFVAAINIIINSID